MKLRFILSLIMALFIGNAMYAGPAHTYWWGDIIMDGEFSEEESRSINKVPISACVSDGTLSVEFLKGVSDVTIVVKNNEGKAVYSSSMNVTASNHTTSISVADYAPGTYVLEFTNAKGGYAYGLFTID